MLSVVAALCLSGCGSSEFDSDAIKATLESSQITLSSEQVVLNEPQIECGVKDDLWNPPSGNSAQLADRGRDLKFTDDVRLHDPDVHVPYVQVSGTFPVQVSDVSSIRDDGPDGKLANVRLGIVINQECFSGGSLPLMGIKRGKFTPDAAPVFRFKGNGKDYSLDKLMH